jgi:hypothetical protein
MWDENTFRAGRGQQGNPCRSFLLYVARGTFTCVIVVLLLQVCATAVLARSFSINVVSTATVTVDESQTSGYLAPDFVGLSYEASKLATTGFDPTQGNLVALLRTLNKWGNIRVGGNTVDRDTFWQPNNEPVPTWAKEVVKPTDIDRLARFSRATNWKVELAVNLGHLDAASIANEAQYASTSLGRQLKDLECGNEPNQYAKNGLRDTTYDYSQYKADFETCAAAIGGRAPIAGPDTTGAYITSFASDEASRVNMITQHLYALSNCGSTKGTATDLLSATTDTSEFNKVSARLTAAQAQHLPLRLDETNSASCGGLPDVSDGYASSLWAVDYMLLMAEQGVAGVNFHGGLDVCTSGSYSPVCAASAADLQVNMYRPQPVYYGMLFVNLVGTGAFYPVTVTSTNNMTAYAIRGMDGRTRVVVVEKDDPAVGEVNVTLNVGKRSGIASVIHLTGSSLTSNQNISIQGATVKRSGFFFPGFPTLIRGSNGSYTIPVQTGSATLITLL